MQVNREVVAHNVKWLRKLYGETQLQLGEAISVDATAISNIERAATCSPDTIALIARHYGVPADLLYSDNPHSTKMFTTSNISAFGSLVANALVGFFPGESPEGSDFRNACEECVFLGGADALRSDPRMVQARLDRCIQVFAAHVEEYPAETNANEVSAIVLQWLRADDPAASLLAHALAANPNISDEDYVRLLPSMNDLQARAGNPRQNKMIEASYDRVTDCLCELRRIPAWADYAERCVALLYLMGLTDSGLDPEASALVGLEMLKAQALLGNEESLRLLLRMLALHDED